MLSSYPLQTAVQLHGFEEVVLLGPQAAAHVLTDCSDLAAFGLNWVLSIVRFLDQIITLTGQHQGSVQHLLWTSVEWWLLTPPVFLQLLLIFIKSVISGSSACLNLFFFLLNIFNSDTCCDFYSSNLLLYNSDITGIFLFMPRLDKALIASRWVILTQTLSS